MKFMIALVTFAISVSYAQEIQQDIDKLQGAINSDDWTYAAKISKSLKEKIAEARNGSLSTDSSSLVDSILNWMPPDVETLVVAQEPFDVEKPEGATVYVAGMLGFAEKGELLKRFERRTVTLAVLGARKFGEGGPADDVSRLGLIPYQGCAVYQFSEAVSDLLLPRAPDRTLAGHAVWESKGTESEGPDWETFFVTVLDPHLVSVCNNQDFLRELLERRTKPQLPRALPPNLREWSLVDRKSPVWGISHYRNGALAGGLLESPDVKGIAVDFGKAAFAARVISGTDPWQEIAKSPDIHGAAKSRQIDPGVWELRLRAQGQEADMGVLVFMGALGFVVLI